MGQQLHIQKKQEHLSKFKMDAINFALIVLFHMQEEELEVENAESIIKEITQIAQNGIKEVVITGIHVASYGRDFGNENGLIELLEKINEIEGIKRV